MTTTASPSQTALMAAAARAAHLIVDSDPFIFADTLAGQLLGDRAEELLDYHRHNGTHPILAGARTQVTCRSRYTERCLTAAVEQGVRQYVLLGAGLDSFAYRSELARQVRVFEVDHPDTQEWKRRALGAAGIAAPENLTFLPADFEDGAHVVPAEVDRSQPAVFSWLGVTEYLTRTAIGATLDAVSAFPPGSELVFDYMLPAELRDEAGATYVELVGPVTAERGEPWLTFLHPDEMGDLLAEHGLELVEQVGQRDTVEAAMWDRRDALRPARLSHIAHARVP